MDSISPDTPQKQCSKCPNSYPATAEFFQKDNKGRLAAECKICRKAYSAQYRAAHKEQESERGKRYYAAHREEVLANQRQRIETHRDEYLARRERYKGEYERERSRRRRQQKHYQVYHKQYRVSHQEGAVLYGRQYRQENGRELNEKKKKYLQTEKGSMVGRTHAHRRRAQKRASENGCTTKQLQEQMKRQKGHCYYCHIKLGKTYHLDHVVPLSRGGAHDISNVVFACPPCNLSKNDKLPHEWDGSGRLL